MPEFKCSDIGMQCGFKTQAPSREEILLKIGMHAAKAHDMNEVPENVLKAIQNAIKY
jgi:predicted small metal-binding protein